MHRVHRHYSELLPRDTEGRHPVDDAVYRMREVRVIDRAVRSAWANLRQRMPDDLADLWIKYEDLRLCQRAIHDERFFDVGFEMGQDAAAGRRSRRPRSPKIRSLGDAVAKLVVASDAPAVAAAITLLERTIAVLTKRRR